MMAHKFYCVGCGRDRALWMRLCKECDPEERMVEEEIVHPAQENKNDDYYCLFLFQRKKDIPELHKSTVCVFSTLAKAKHLKKDFEIYQKIADEYNARVYVSVNPRDIRKARKDLIVRLVQTEDQHNTEPANIQAQMFSSLMRCPVKENKKFMIDVDTKEEEVLKEIHQLLFEHGVVVHAELETKNGCHIIVDPFDIRIITEHFTEEEIEIKKDGMTVPEWLTQKNDVRD